MNDKWRHDNWHKDECNRQKCGKSTMSQILSRRLKSGCCEEIDNCPFCRIEVLEAENKRLDAVILKGVKGSDWRCSAEFLAPQREVEKLKAEIKNLQGFAESMLIAYNDTESDDAAMVAIYDRIIELFLDP